MQLILKSIQKKFEDNTVLKDVNYTFETGKIYALLGRNGAGKTTLFNVLYGEEIADNGSFTIADNGVHSINENDIGMCFTEPLLPEFLTAYEYTKFLLESIGEHTDPNVYLDKLALSQESRSRLIKTYSSGMKAKMSLIQLLILKPKVILLDEPLTSLDVVIAASVKTFLRELKHDHIIIFSTHILELASDLCDEIVLLHKGVLSSLERNTDHEEFEKRVIEALGGQA